MIKEVIVMSNNNKYSDDNSEFRTAPGVQNQDYERDRMWKTVQVE
jgi:hypothetical protein